MKLLRDKVLDMAKELRQHGKAAEAGQRPGTGPESSEVNAYFACPFISWLDVGWQ